MNEDELLEFIDEQIRLVDEESVEYEIWLTIKQIVEDYFETPITFSLESEDYS